MPRLWWALTQDELPPQDGGLPKDIEYYILYLVCTQSGGDVLTTKCREQAFYYYPSVGVLKRRLSLGAQKSHCFHVKLDKLG